MRLLLLSSLLIGVIIACDPKIKDIIPRLSGRWEVQKGFRDEKETGILNGAYIAFEANNIMRTNIPLPNGTEAPTAYEVKNKSIRQKLSPEIVYTIEALTDSTLELGFDVRGVHFAMHLKRVTEVPDSTGFLPETR
jgi:hypothetical protein